MVLGGVLFVLFRYSLHSLQADSQGLDYIVWFIKVALIQSGVYLVAVWVVWRASASRSTLLIVLIFAALFRLTMLTAPPLLSDDVYRYVWDGRVQAAGVNPYRYVPADEAVAPLRDEAIYPYINRREFAPTMYPPVAEGIYLLTTRISESVTWMKATMVGFEAITMWALVALLASFGLPRQRALIYAWHPLIVWEFAGSGHVDAAAIAFITLALLARRRGLEAATGLALASAALVKFYPAILFPAFYRRWSWKMPVVFGLTVIVAYVPYLTVGAQAVLGYIPGYMAEEGMRNGERFFILSLARRLFSVPALPETAFLIFAGFILAGLTLRFLRRRGHTESHYIGRALTLAAIFTILLSPRYPWYFTWLIPFLCVAPSAPLFYVTSASFMLYSFWLGEAERRLTIDLALYAPLVFITALTFWLRCESKTAAREKQPSQLEKEHAMTATTAEVPVRVRVSVVIPALDEEATIGEVVRAVPRDIAGEVIVVDNGSRDRTVERARDAGARVVRESRRGYGSACQAGVRACASECDIVVFLDGDGSEYPESIVKLVDPILDGTHDFVISSRLRGRREPGSMHLTQVIAGRAAGLLVGLLYGVSYTDMGPFRAIRRGELERLGMREMSYGWPLEMQMRAAKAGLRILEVPVDYRRRAGGESKVSGTVRGTILGGSRILMTAARVALERS